MNREQHLLLEHLPAPGQAVVPDKAQSHHLLRVLRLRSGQALTLLDGRGTVAHAVLHVEGNRALLAVGESALQAPAAPALEAWVPVIKESRLEWAVEKLVELAVCRIRLYTSAYGGDRNRPPDMNRLARIRQAAMEQCGLAWLPELHPPRPLAELLEGATRPLVLADPEPAGSLPAAAPDGLAFVAGPEGGFNADERARLQATAVCSLPFGTSVLRAETALLALAAHLRCTLRT